MSKKNLFSKKYIFLQNLFYHSIPTSLLTKNNKKINKFIFSSKKRLYKKKNYLFTNYKKIENRLFKSVVMETVVFFVLQCVPITIFYS